MDQLTLHSRSEIPIEHTWDSASVFPTVEAWEAAFQHLGDLLPQVTRFSGHLSDGPAVLADVMFLLLVWQVLRAISLQRRAP